jgi:hypothetical protein
MRGSSTVRTDSAREERPALAAAGMLQSRADPPALNSCAGAPSMNNLPSHRQEGHSGHSLKAVPGNAGVQPVCFDSCFAKPLV